MSKQLLMNERPADNGPSYGGGDDWPKASIGNYKGVMLCNRPNEVGGPRKADRTGPGAPFNSRVQPDEPVGWNPTKKLAPKALTRRKKVDPNNALLKHRKYLKQLEDQRQREREEKEREEAEKDGKVNKFKENAEKQRKKIQDLKRTGGLPEDSPPEREEGTPEPVAKEVEQAKEVVQEAAKEEARVETVSRLTEENLRKSDRMEGEKKRKTGAKKEKPAWAMTEKELEEQKEKEIDDLLEFAYELDYEKYMDDFEVRQALAIIKDRVKEIKQDADWKDNMAREWNEAAEEKPEDDARSAVTYHSSKTAASKKSLRSQVLEAIQEEGTARQDWDRSVKGDKPTTEDRIANRLAAEVLRENAKLRGVHSASSIKRLLEKEAKRQLLNNDGYKGPVVSVIKDKDLKRDEIDPSYLPYLHKNPAI